MKGIILDDSLSLQVKNGSLVLGDPTYQNQQILLLAEKGEFKFRPMRGVGTKRYLETPNRGELAREIRTEFIADGMIVNKISIENEKLIVDALYGNG